MIPERRRMPPERGSMTHKFKIKGEPDVKGYLTVGFYEDGTVGEVFVKIDQQGSEVSGLVDAWAIAVSMLLQQGTPLKQIIDKFRGSRFEPSGLTDIEGFGFVTSPLDLICRILIRYVNGVPTNAKTP